MNVAGWLHDLGLGQYEPAFRKNHIAVELLPRLTAEDLVAMGVASVGHRRILLDAIAALTATPDNAALEPASVHASAKPTSAERRQLTVMFCDLVGSTALSTRLDPEDLRDLIGVYQHCVADTVAPYEGFIAKYMGDGVLVYFGYPQAHEDDAERAVRAGLALREAISRLSHGSGVALAVRIGIATGHVVVGDLIGEGVAREQAVVGETPNLAARLQALAEPDGVVIAPGTHRLVAGIFDLKDLGENELRGFDEKVNAWRVLGLSPAESRFAARTATGLTRLIGRQHELGILLDLFERAKDGEGQVVLLSGEPGIGKSRIIRALGERLATEPHAYASCFCSPFHVNSALHPLAILIERSAQFERDDTPEVRLGKLKALLSRLAMPVDEVAPLFAALLGLPAGDHFSPIVSTPAAQKQRTLQILVDFQAALAVRQPALAVYEDVHWADPSTFEFLDILIERVKNLNFLLIVTFRPDFNAPWANRNNVTTLLLRRLARRQGISMVKSVSGGKSLPDEVMNQIIAKADGIPLFIEELSKTLLESAPLRELDDRYVLAGPLPPVAIPPTLHDSLLARLDRLGRAKEIAQTGAALGREFSYEFVRAVSGLPDEELTNALARLTSTELVFQRGHPPHAIYVFKHALVQDAAYASLLKARRQKLHSKIAQTLRRHFPDRVAAEPEMLARHYTEAGEMGLAIDYWIAAGERATERSANTEAIAHLQRGLGLVKELPDDVERARRELTLQIALGTPLMAIQGYGSGELARANARARQLCERVGDAEQLLPILYRQFAYQVVKSNPRRALRLAEEFRHAAESQSAEGPALAARRCLGFCHYQLGELTLSRTHFEWVLAHFVPERHRALAHQYGQNPQPPAQAVLSVVLQLLGYPDQAVRASDAAITQAREAPHAATMAYAQTFATCVLGAVRRDWRTILELAPSLMAVTKEQRITMWHAWTEFFYNRAVAELSPTPPGIAKLSECLANIDSIGTTNNLTFHLALVAEVHARLGQIETALGMIDKALVQVQATDERWWEAELYRLKGETLLRQGTKNTTEAETLFEQAISIARGQDAKSLELRAATSLARLWTGQGKYRQARDLLASIFGWFTEGLETPDLNDAKALLDEIGIQLTLARSSGDA